MAQRTHDNLRTHSPPVCTLRPTVEKEAEGGGGERRKGRGGRRGERRGDRRKGREARRRGRRGE